MDGADCKSGFGLVLVECFETSLEVSELGVEEGAVLVGDLLPPNEEVGHLELRQLELRSLHLFKYKSAQLHPLRSFCSLLSLLFLLLLASPLSLKGLSCLKPSLVDLSRRERPPLDLSPVFVDPHQTRSVFVL